MFSQLQLLNYNSKHCQPINGFTDKKSFVLRKWIEKQPNETNGYNHLHDAKKWTLETFKKMNTDADCRKYHLQQVSSFNIVKGWIDQNIGLNKLKQHTFVSILMQRNN